MRTFLRLSLLVAAMLGFGVSSVKLAGQAQRVLIPADAPNNLEPPLCVDTVAEDGTRGIRIPAGVGRGWCQEAGGSAIYAFHIPADATYNLWGYCLWQGACTNAVYVQIDGGTKVILGNDPIYGSWHWVRGTGWRLARGSHTLTLSNHSDDIAIQRLLLLTNPFERPEGVTEASYDIFYDGFDGCAGGNVLAWSLDGPTWKLTDPGPSGGQQRWLEGKAEAEPSSMPAFAVVGESSWQDYSVSSSMRVGNVGCVGVCFSYRGPQDYVAIQWRPEQTRQGMVTMELVQVSDGQPQLLGTASVQIAPDRWLGMDITSTSKGIALSIDGAAAARIGATQSLNGRFGFFVRGGHLDVDNVHITRMAGARQPATIAATHPREVRCGANR